VRCFVDGALAGTAAALVGGLPSILTSSAEDLDASVRAIRLLVPGGRGLRSPWGQRLVGGAAHLLFSVVFATAYACLVRRRPIAFALALWGINFKLIAPEEYLAEDRSRTLLDHLAWGAVLGTVVGLRGRQR
jgi:hypothetical protein